MSTLQRKSIPHTRAFFFVPALALLCCPNSNANGIPVGGTILGIFSNPVQQGIVANDPALGQQTYLDNSGTANFTINNSTDPTLVGTPPQQGTGSALSWGVLTGSSGPTTFSTVTFFGNPIPANFNQPFQLGTITYLNGTSDLNSLIFGATLSFYANSATPANFLGSTDVIITTTSNLGQSTAQDADYINLCGGVSNICGLSIEAVEATQGGTGVTVNFTGEIVGDPTLTVDNVAVASGQSSTTNGFIGNDPPIGQTPEPGTLMLVPGSLIAGLLWLRRRSV